MSAAKNLIGFLAITFTSVGPNPAQAEPLGWVVNRTVIALVNTGNGGFNIRLTPDLSGCVSQSGYGPTYASVYPSHPGLNRIKADMLTALATGKPVSLYLSDNVCTVGETMLGLLF
jgi:hypothetical protein